MKDVRTVTGKYLRFCCLLLIATLGFSFTLKTSAASASSAVSAAPASSAVSAAASSATAASVRSAVSASARSAGLFALYDNLQLGALDLSRDAFHRAVEGFLELQTAGRLGNTNVLSIVDFSLPSSEKRLFIIDMRNERLLFHTYVAHGRNSGALMATRFSNRCSSNKSSLGFYLTGDPFMGQHGYSLRLEGMEPGWNDHAQQRAIVMHPAPYVSEEHVRRWGSLGRSEGCPAIPERLHTAIIDHIKGGSCLFLYAPDDAYLDRADPFS